MHAGGRPRASAAALVPVAAVVAVDPAGWYPFGPAKQGAVFVAALVAVAAAVGRPGRLPRRVEYVWLALVAWLALAAVLGVDRWYAWIGTPERRYGWLTWALVGACAWAGARLGGGLRWFSRSVALAALWCGAYSLVELWWRAPVATTSVTSRLGGPFGSAAYLGAALCLLLPVAVAVAADRRESMPWRVLGGVASLTALVALVGAGTRAAWVAMVAVGIVVLVARRPPIRAVLLVVGAVVVALLAIAPRLGDVTDRSGGGGASRSAEWRVALRVIGERPVVGAGPEGYRIVFADGVDADYERTYGRDVLPDRAHSALLDVAAIGGVPAAAMYGALLAAVAWAAWKALGDGDGLRAGLAAAALAYLAQQLVLFPLAELDPTFWLIAGALLSNSAAGQVADSPSSPATESPAPGPRILRQDKWRNRPDVLPQSLKVCVVGVAVVVFVVSVVGVAADRAARAALAEDGGLPAAERAARLRPDVVRYHLLVASLHADRGSVAGARDAVQAAERAANVSPGDPIVRRTLAEARTQLAAVTGDPADVAVALADWEHLVAADPHCDACRQGLGNVRLLAVELGSVGP